MNIVIRADASFEIGSGHVMRCLTLADALREQGAKITFMCRSHQGNINAFISEKGYQVLSLAIDLSKNHQSELAHSKWLGSTQINDANACKSVFPPATDWIIIDHYALDTEWESSMRSYTQKILVIDDLADRKHNCDLLLDQNFYQAMDERYIGKVPLHCKLMLGPGYALLREEFCKLRKKAKPRSGSIKHILVFFGGMDADNHTNSAIEALVNVGMNDCQIDVVIGAQHPFQQQIQASCTEHGLNFHKQTSQMAKLMLEADLAIGAGGTATYERLYLRLPAILKPVAFNQESALFYMCKMGLFDLFFTQQELEEKLTAIFKNGNSLPPDCVEDGKYKLTKIMSSEFTELSSIKPWDIRRTYKWLQNKKLRDDFMVSECPELSGHINYWRKLLKDAENRVFSILYFGDHVGNCGLKNINTDKGTSELWIYLGDEAVRGKGIAQSAIQQLLLFARNDLSGKSVCLHVAKKNLGAIHVYKKSGFFDLEEPLAGCWLGRDSEILSMQYIL